MSDAQRTVLLVEDEPGDALLAQTVYAKELPAVSLVTLEDGEAAIAYLEGRGEWVDRVRWPLPAYVLLDLKLPRRSGFEVLEAARQRPELARLPIVVLSSSHVPDDIARACRLGANSYLVKPVGLGELRALLTAVDHYWTRVDRLAR